MEPQLTSNAPLTDSTNDNKKSSFLITLLSVLLLVSVFIAGFFAWQTQNLVREINSNKIELTPIATQTSDQDSTQNWKIYSNDKLGFSFKLAPVFKYPEIITPSESNSFSNKEGVSSPLELSDEDILLESTIYTNIDESSLKKVNASLASNLGSITNQPFQPIGSIKKLADLENGGSIFEESPTSINEVTYYIAIWNNNNNIHVLKMFAMKDLATSNKSIFEEMAKTYNFTENESQTACTMDAKICPDGSAVGRSGPKCEFAPCPTPKP